MRLRVTLWVVMAMMLCLAGGAAKAETVWFVVAERSDVGEERHDDSFLLPLSDPALIAQARQRVAEGLGSSVGSIVIANIAPGPDGLNRDTRREGQPLWSWHVQSVEGFADLAIELCDGWPSFVQQDVDAFIANTGGRICFWSYTVVAELTTPPLFRINEGLDGAWHNAGMSGQGFLLDVLGAQGQMFVAWFTFLPAGTAPVGDPGHRWYTAQGAFNGSRAPLNVVLTTGGAFADPRSVVNQPAGTLTLDFSDCNRGNASWNLSNGASGQMAIERVVPLTSCGRR